jgi:hypothetical protein
MKTLRISLLLVLASTFAYTLRAQFTTAVQDGVIGAGEYGVHTNGQNQQQDGGTTYYMCWDANNLYLAFSGSNYNESATVYFDYDPIIPVNGGNNANGSNQGLYTYDRNQMMLPFRSDFVLYFKNGYNEYRRADAAGYWGGNMAFALATGNNGGTNTAEIAIPWNTLTNGAGRPAAFNWFIYKVYDYGPATNGIYSALPVGNPNCTCNQDPSRLYATRYYNVLNTANGSSTLPFSTTSFTYSEDNSAPTTGGYYLNGGTFYDLTINDNSLNNNDNAAAFHLPNNLEISNRVLLAGNTIINHNLYIAPSSALLPADNSPTAVLANLTFSANNGSIYNFGRFDANPEASSAGDWNNRRIDLFFSGTTRLMPSNLFKELWRMSNVTVNVGAQLLGPLNDSVSLELQWGTFTNLGSVDFGNGAAGFADIGTRGDWSQHNDYFMTGAGLWRLHNVLIGRNSSKLQPLPGGGVARLLIQGNFENYDEFVGKVGAARLDVVMAGRKRQFLMGNTTETTGATTNFYNLEIANNNLLSNNNNTADVWFLSFGGGTIDYFVTGQLAMTDGDLVTRDRLTSNIHRFTLRDSATVNGTLVRSNIGLNGSCFVDGPIRYEVENANLVARGFPVGKTKTVNGYQLGDARPIVLQVDHDLATKTTYVAEMWLDDRSTTYTWPIPVPEVIAWISQQRYWNVTKLPGANVQSAMLTLSYDVIERTDGVINSPALRIVKDDGAGNWVNITPLGPGGSANGTGFITSHPFTAFSDFTLASVDGLQPLPIDLMSFEATKENEMVRLDWKTAREVNSAYFEVECSFNRMQFHSIGTVAAAGNSSDESDYQFFDSHPDNGHSHLYYRIKSVDNDGQATYSAVRTVIMEENGRPTLTLYPNPAAGFVTLELLGAEKLHVSEVRIVDILGQEVKNLAWPEGQIRGGIDLSSLRSGVYFVGITTDEGVLKEKLVVQ